MRKQLDETIDDQIRRILREVVVAESVGHAANPGAGIARRLDIDFGVADKHHLRGGRAEFAQDRFDAHGVRLLALEAVAAIHIAKVIGDAELMDNTAAHADRLIGVDSHWHPLERIECFADAGIQNRVVEFVRGIILDEKFEAEHAIFLGRGAAQGSCDQCWSALSDVAENLLVRQRISAQLRERGVHGKSQIEFGIDQRAVQIEDQRAYFGETGDGVPLGNVSRNSFALSLAGSPVFFFRDGLLSSQVGRFKSGQPGVAVLLKSSAALLEILIVI
jgi:hypothetical protein